MLKRAFSRFTHLLEYLFHYREVESGLDEELRSSFEMMVDQRVRQGISSTTARRLTRMEFEGLEQVKERTRDSLAGAGIQTAIRDARCAWRDLLRHKPFTFISVLMLALGIGATTAVLSIFYAVLMHPLPYAKPDDGYLGQLSDSRYGARAGFWRDSERSPDSKPILRRSRGDLDTHAHIHG